MALTPKQEKFCQCIVSGMTGKDSYIAAYDTKAGDATIYTESTRLLARKEIQDRITALRKPLEIKAVTSAISERDRKRAVLWHIIETGDDNAKCRALDILNRMDAEYVNINHNIEEKTDISHIDMDTLKQLTGHV